MAPGYSISGIGLGNYGLGTGGAYSSYDMYMPSMMGMNGYNTAFNGYGGYGMMGMYNPIFMSQMQNQIETMNLTHAGNMHQGLLDYQTKGYAASDSAMIKKLAANGSVQQLVENLHKAVQGGDQDAICEEFDKLRHQIFATYKDEIAARGTEENPLQVATRITEALYTAISGQSLRNDIIRNGDGAWKNGFMKGFRTGHHDTYVDETLNHIYGERVDQRASKELRQGVGYAVGTGASVLEKGAYGLAAGAGAYGLVKGVGALGSYALSKPLPKFTIKGGSKFALAGAAIAALGDLIWKVTDRATA